MNSSPDPLKRILISATGLILLVIGGIIVLMITASRVGEHKTSTFGQAYYNFEKSWGGEIKVSPPRFYLQKTERVKVMENNISGSKLVTKDIEIFPVDIHLNTSLDYNEQVQDWISFNAYQSSSSDRFIILNNTTSDSGVLMMEFNMPRKANLMNSVEVFAGQRQINAINLNRKTPVLSSFSPGDSIEIQLNYAVKGMDLYEYDLSDYSENITGNLQALFRLNNPNYQISRLSIPHQIKETNDGIEILFNMNDFASNQSLGILLYKRVMHLDKMENMMYYSPVSLVLFLLVIFFYSQIYNKRFSGLHYFFTAAILVFYFLFIAYLIRFFGIWISIGISSVLTYLMAILYFPKVFGKTFFLTIIVPHLLVLTIVFTLIFLMPVFQGISFLIMNFLILVTLMLAITRSEISGWQVITG